MTDVAKDVNHIHSLDNFVADGIDYLPGDFLREKENLVKFLSVYLERMKAVDEMMVNLAEGRLLQNAGGVNLDEIGAQVGIERNGLSDMNYRAIITILLASTAKHGTRPEVIGTLQQLFGTENFTTYKGDNYRFDINIFNSCFEIETAIEEIKDMLPMPTYLRLIKSDGIPFGFKDDAYALGFGSVGSSSRTGPGGLSSLVYTSEEENTLI